jgi:cytochrome d ubiquinol oxidase subunit II
LFSGAYLPMLLLLVALIGRGVAFEYRGKVDSVRWRAAWDRVIVGASLLAPLSVGLVLTTTVLGLPLDANGNRVGSAVAAFGPETLLGALAIAAFALVHGTVFVALKTEGEIRERAVRFARRIALPAVVALAALLLVVQVDRGHGWTWIPLAVAVFAALVAVARIIAGHEGQAFAALGVAIAASVITLFGALYPDVLPSTMDAANSLTVHGASSSPYTLTVMTWVAAFGAPVVLLYQGWTYWVFRRRIGARHIPPVHTP